MCILMVTGIEVPATAPPWWPRNWHGSGSGRGRKTALAALRHREFLAVVLDETMAECDPAAAEAVWGRAGLAIPVQINFALSGSARLIARFAPPFTAASGSRRWPGAPPPPPSRLSSNPR